MAQSSDARIVRLGPMAIRILAGRRRWLRWAAIAVLFAVIAAALSHGHRKGAAQASIVPTLVARRLLSPGHVVRPDELEMVPRLSAAAGVHPFVRAADAVGQAAAREIRAGEVVAPGDVLPVLRYYGVAARVPPGMRAVSLVVPPSATFGGELAPHTRVDLIGAFEPARGQPAAALLGTGIVLRVPAPREPASLNRERPTVAGAASGASPFVEIDVAIPRDREREIVLAQAFGRVFVTVHSATAEPPRGDPTGVLQLLPYLHLLPAGVASAVPVSPVPRAGASGPGAALPRPVQSTARRAPAPPSAQPAREAVPAWVVDVIEGGERFDEPVPRVGEPSGTGGDGSTGGTR